MTAGLELKSPVADAGCDNEDRAIPLFKSVTKGVFTDPLTNMPDRNELPSMRMSAQNQIRAGGRFTIKIIRLVIQDHDIVTGIQLF